MVASPEAAGSPGGESPAQQHKTSFPAICLFFFIIHLRLVLISINVFYLSVIQKKEPLGGVLVSVCWKLDLLVSSGWIPSPADHHDSQQRHMIPEI